MQLPYQIDGSILIFLYIEFMFYLGDWPRRQLGTLQNSQGFHLIAFLPEDQPLPILYGYFATVMGFKGFNCLLCFKRSYLPIEVFDTRGSMTLRIQYSYPLLCPSIGCSYLRYSICGTNLKPFYSILTSEFSLGIREKQL